MNSSQHIGTVIRTSGPRKAGNSEVFNATLKCTREWNGKTFDSYIDCEVWGKQADEASAQLGEGVSAWVSGEPQAQAYESKNGEWKAKLVCKVRSFGVLGGNAAPAPKREGKQRKPPPQQGGYEPIDEDSLPF